MLIHKGKEVEMFKTYVGASLEEIVNGLQLKAKSVGFGFVLSDIVTRNSKGLVTLEFTRDKPKSPEDWAALQRQKEIEIHAREVKRKHQRHIEELHAQLIENKCNSVHSILGYGDLENKCGTEKQRNRYVFLNHDGLYLNCYNTKRFNGTSMSWNFTKDLANASTHFAMPAQVVHLGLVPIRIEETITRKIIKS